MGTVLTPMYEDFIQPLETPRPPFDAASVGPVRSTSSARLCADLSQHYARVEFLALDCTLEPLERRTSLDRWRVKAIRESKVVRISSFPVKPRAKAVSALAEPPPPLEFEEDAADDIDLQTALEQIMEGLWPYSAGDHRFMTSS